MKIQEQDGFLEVERAELGPPDTPGEDDVLLNVSVGVSGYSAADQSWVVGSDCRTFLNTLKRWGSNRAAQPRKKTQQPTSAYGHGTAGFCARAALG